MRGAQAFTAGRDIYFGRGRYAPNSPTGRHLLLHEVAHAIQQLGHRSGRGEIELRARSGSGCPQHRDVLGMKAPTADEVVTFYLNRFTGVASLTSEVQRWRDEVSKGNEPWTDVDTTLGVVADTLLEKDRARGSEAAALEADALREREKVRTGVSDARIASFYVDYLKALGKRAEAARWLISFPEIRTMFLDRGTLASLASQRRGSIAALARNTWERDPLFEQATPDRVALILRNYFLGPGRLNPALEVGDFRLQEHPLIGKGLAELDAPLPAGHPATEELLLNELHWGPIQAIHDVDRFRIAVVAQLHAWVTKSGKDFLPSTTLAWVQDKLVPWRASLGLDGPDYQVPEERHRQKYVMAWGFAQVMSRADLASIPGLRSEAAELLAHYANSWAEAVAPAITVWNVVRTIDPDKDLKWEVEGEKVIHYDVRTDTKTELPFTVRNVFDLISAGDSKHFKSIRKYLTEDCARRVFQRWRGEVPPAASYAKIAQAEAVYARDAGYAAFEAPNAYLVQTTPDLLGNPEVLQTIIAHAWFLAELDRLRVLLESYDADYDSSKATETRNAARATALISDPTQYAEAKMPGFEAVGPFYQRQRAGDGRIIHRGQVADWLNAVGSTLGWDDVVAAADRLYQDSRQKRIEIALVGDWRWEIGTELSVILDDFPRSSRSILVGGTSVRRLHDPINRYGPVSMRHVYGYYKRLQYEEEANKLRELIDLARSSKDVPKPPLIDQADVWLGENFVRPQRAILDEARLEVSPEVADQYSLALLQHPKTRDFLNAKAGEETENRSALFVAPQYPPAQLPLVMWAVPLLYPVITELRQYGALNEWVWEYHFGATAPKRPKLVADDDYPGDSEIFSEALARVQDLYDAPPTRAQWDDAKVVDETMWLLLARVAIKGSTDQDTGLAEGLHDILGTLETQQRDRIQVKFDELLLEQRYATAIERNRRTRTLIEALDQYESTARLGYERKNIEGLGSAYRNDMDALAYGAMLDFRAMVRPDEDFLLHKAAWMFELMDAAESTRNRLRKSDDHRLVQSYSMWTALALEYAGDVDKRAALISVLTDWRGDGTRYFTPDASKKEEQIAEDRVAARTQYLGEREKRVRTLDAGFASTITKWHKDRGMWATVGTDTDPGEVGRVGGARAIDVGQTFYWGGPTPWKVLTVFRDFTYHPSVLPEATELSEDNPRRYRGLSVVELSGTPPLTSAERLSDAHEAIDLMLIGHGQFTKLITTKDELWLQEVSHSVTMSLIHTGPAAFLDAMTEIGNLILEVVEFIPGIGQGVALARLAYSIVDFIASGEFIDLMEAITSDPIERIEKAVTTWTDQLQWSKLIVYLLLGSSRGGLPEITRPAKQEPRPIAKGGSGRLRRMAYALMNIGLGIYRALSAVRSRIQEAVFTAQLEIAERPVIQRLLLVMGEYWNVLETVGGALFSDLDRFEPSKIGATVQGYMQSVVDRIAGFTIPTTILQMEDFVGIVLEFIVSRFHGKKGALLQIGVEALKLIGQWKNVESAIALPFKDLEPTLNAGWLGIVELFKEPMSSGRTELIEDFNTAFDALDGLPGFSVKLSEPAGSILQTTEINEEGEEVPAQLPRMDLSGDPIDMFHGPVPMPKLQSGKPIPGDVKAEVEEQMFQHFSDVELHVSGDGDQLLSSLGAKGAAVGTHVILSSDLQLSSAEGRDILLHELGHVTQTRSAPMSGPKPPAPKATPIEIGIRNDPALEAHADAVAKLAKRDGITEPLKIKTSRRGLRPDTGVIPQFLEAMGGDVHTRSFRDTIDEGAPAGMAHLTPSTTDATNKVWPRIEQELKGPFAATAPFSYGRDLIRKHILENVGIKKSIKDAILLIGRRVQKPQDPTSSAERVDMWLDASLFMTELRRYIYGRTGVLVDLKEKVFDIRVKRGKTTKKLPALDRNDPVAGLTVRFVNLGLLSAGSGLYKQIISDSFGDKMRDASGKGWEPADALHRQALRTQVVAYARSASGPGMWSRRAMKVKASVVEEIRERTQETIDKDKSEASKLPAASLPTWADYIKWTKGDFDTTHGSIGLRISNYETKKTKIGQDAQWGTERESHHITQFLLAEYFAHGADYKQNPADKCAFKHLRAQTDEGLYPFLEVQSGMPKTIDNARKPIPIATLAQGRGGPMPAILLARSTHRSGGLHVSTKAGDFGEGVSTQSQVVSAKYRTALADAHPEYAKAESSDKAEFEKYMKTGKGADATEQENIKTAVHTAIQQTYRWMRGHMQSRLEPAMLEHERAYYQSMAKAHEIAKRPGATPTDDDLDYISDEARVAELAGYSVSRAKMASDLQAVAQEAKKQNDQGLAVYGLFVT